MRKCIPDRNSQTDLDSDKNKDEEYVIKRRRPGITFELINTYKASVRVTELLS